MPTEKLIDPGTTNQNKWCDHEIRPCQKVEQKKSKALL